MEIKNSAMGAICPAKSLDEETKQTSQSKIVGTNKPEEFEKEVQNVLKSLASMAQAILKMNGGLKYIQICSPKDIIIEYHAEDGEKKILNKYGEEICTLNENKAGYQIFSNNDFIGEIHKNKNDNKAVLLNNAGEEVGKISPFKHGGFQVTKDGEIIMEFQPEGPSGENNIVLNGKGEIIKKGVNAKIAEELGEALLAASLVDQNSKD